MKIVYTSVKASYAQAISGSSTYSNSKEKTELKIVAHLQDGKGHEQIRAMEQYLYGNVEQFWSLIPDLRRMGSDFDPGSGSYWIPEMDINKYPNELQEIRKRQSENLARIILNKASATVGSEITCDMVYGSVNQFNFKAEPSDGVALYAAIIIKYCKSDKAHIRRLGTKLGKAWTEFKATSQSSIADAVSKVNTMLQEAENLYIKVPWDTVAVPIMATLSERNYLYGIALRLELVSNLLAPARMSRSMLAQSKLECMRI